MILGKAFIGNLILPGLGFAYYYSWFSSLVFAISLMLSNLAVLAAYAHTDWSVSKMYSIGLWVSLSVFFIAHFIVGRVKRPVVAKRKQRIFNVAIASFLVGVLLWGGTRIARSNFVHTVINLQTSTITSVIPIGSCGYIKVPNRNFSEKDVVAYRFEFEGKDQILLGKIRDFVGKDEFFIESLEANSGVDSNTLGTIKAESVIGKVAEVLTDSPPIFPIRFLFASHCFR